MPPRSRQLSDLEAQLVALDSEAAAKEEESVALFLQVLSEKSHRVVQTVAKEQGVKASGSTTDILARIREAMTA